MFWPDGVPRYLETPPELVHAPIARWARKAGDEIAVYAGKDSLTYSDLEGRSESVASHLLGADALEGSMGLTIPNRIETVTGLVAILKAGSSFQCGAGYKKSENVIGLDDIRKWSDGEELNGARRKELTPSDAAFIYSQGELSSVSRSHECYASSLDSFITFMGMGPDSTTLIPYPITEDYGSFALFCTLRAGGTAVLTEGFDFSKMNLPSTSARNWCFAKMADLVKLTRAPSSKSGCNYLVACETSPSLNEERRMEKLLGSELLTMYYSATTGVAICRHPSRYLPSSVGIPVTNFEVRICQEYYGNLFEIVNPDMKGQVLHRWPHD